MFVNVKMTMTIELGNFECESVNQYFSGIHFRGFFLFVFSRAKQIHSVLKNLNFYCMIKNSQISNSGIYVSHSLSL
jgi:hypothetical protein